MPGPSKADGDLLEARTFKPIAEVPLTSVQAKAESQDGGKELNNHQRQPSPEAKRPSPSVLNNIQRLKDTLTYQPSIEVQVSSVSNSTVQSRSTNRMGSTSAAAQGPVSGTRETAPSPLIAPRPMTPASPSSSLDEPPTTPSRHSRIPSTGQRATVMDVAQALQQHEQHIREASWTPEPASEPEPEPQEIPSRQETLSGDDGVDDTPRTDVKATIAGWGRNFGPGGQQTDRRRSSYDRFSVPTLPPLVEVKTPTATPHGSLSRGFIQTEQSVSKIQELNQVFQDSVSAGTNPVATVEVELPQSELELKSGSEEELKAEDSLVHLGWNP